MTISNLLGYVRKSNSGNAIKINLSVEAFNKAEKYSSRDGKQYVSLTLGLHKIQQLLDGNLEVTGIVQLVD